MAKKVAVFGDSISKGIVFDGDKLRKIEGGFVNIIAEEYGFEIKNYSRYGLTLGKLAKTGLIESFLAETVGETDNYAVFCIGGNDADFDWKEVALSPHAEHFPHTPADKFEELLGEKVKLLLNSGVKVILTTIPPVDSERYFRNVICKIADGEKVLEFFDGDVTNISRRQEAYNYGIIRVAAENSVPVIDLRTGFLLDRKYLRRYCIDGIHPNGEGHRFMADEVARTLAAQGFGFPNARPSARKA